MIVPRTTLSPPKGGKFHRKPDGSNDRQPGHVHFPLEYNGEKLDKSPSNPYDWPAAPRYRSQTWELELETTKALFDYLEVYSVLDVGPYQIEFVEQPGKTRKVKRAAIYNHSDKLGTVRIGQTWANLELTCKQCTAAVLLPYLRETLQTYFIPGSIDVERLIPVEQRVQIGVKGLPALINLDMLKLKLSEGHISELAWIGDRVNLEPYELRLLTGGGHGYARKAEVWLKGRRIGIVLWDALFASCTGTARYEIGNAELYDTWNTGTFRDEIIDGFTRMIGAKVIGVGRVDIALDGPGVIKFLETVHRREIIATRQKAYHEAKKIVGLATDEIEGFGFGKRGAGKYVRCYNKTKEIADMTAKKGEGYKSYIPEFWQANGLDISQPVGRLEVELLHRYTKTLEGFSWEHLFDRQRLAALLETVLHKYFRWVEADSNDGKINRRATVEIIDFSAVKQGTYKRAEVKPVVGGLRTPKILTKRLLIDAAFAKDKADFSELFGSAHQYLVKHNLYTWLKARLPFIQAEVNDMVADGGYEVYPTWREQLAQVANKEFYRTAAHEFNPSRRRTGDV